MKERLPISVCMISGAEAHRIARALESVRGWTAEIIVMRNDNVHDGTEGIASRHGARVFREPWKSYVAQKTRLPTRPRSLGCSGWTPMNAARRSS